jgi:ABC-type multidrug transport system fused ATPase/permease subunit
MIRNLVVISASIFVLFSINIKLTFLVLLIVPFYLTITIFYSRRNKVLVREYQDVQAEIAGLVAERFSGIQVVKAYSTENIEVQRYKDAINKGYLINKKKIFLSGMYNSCSEFLPYLGMMLVLWYGGEMVINGST